MSGVLIWVGGMCGETWLKPESAESAGFGKDSEPKFYHALLHPLGWAADSNAPRIPPSQIGASGLGGRERLVMLRTE